MQDRKWNSAMTTVAEEKTSNSDIHQQSPIKNRKIVFLANYTTFLGDIIAYVSKENEVRTYEKPSSGRIREMVSWADIVWVEWCDNIILEVSRLPGKTPVICRLHSYEVFTDMPKQVHWDKVNHLLFVNPFVRLLFEQQVICDIPRSVIYNGVDTNKFIIPPGKTYGKKIASVGYINYKKNPALLLYCFKKIYEYDPNYTLHIAGEFQDPRYVLYFEHYLKENLLPVSFDGWVDDMTAWYADKDFIISTSLFESFHYSVAEGMASGLLPLVHNWSGAKELYPAECIFNDADESLQLVRRYENADKHALAKSNREFIRKRYNLNEKCEEIARLMAQVAEQGEQ